MPTVLPSQVCGFIDEEFTSINRETKSVKLSPAICAALRTLVRLVDEIPQALYQGNPTDFHALVLSLETIRLAVTRWQGARDQGVAGYITLAPSATGRPHSQFWCSVNCSAVAWIRFRRRTRRNFNSLETWMSAPTFWPTWRTSNQR